MKKIIFALGIILIATSVKAQWTDNGSNLTTSDNVGIGTSNPTEKLELTAPKASFGIRNSGSSSLGRIHAAVNDWIGISQNIEFLSGWNFQLDKSSIPGWLLKLDARSNVDVLELWRFPAGQTTRTFIDEYSLFLINGEGKVGIGTRNPMYKLDVNGTINATSILIDGLPISNSSTLWSSNNNDLNYSTGRVSIGTINAPASYMLAIGGKTITEEVKVALVQNWPDFVFEDNYELRSLEETEQFISENNHLPEIPSEEEVINNGINLGEMDSKLLQKIEELTLYMIEMNKRVNQLETENMELKEKIQRLEN